MRTTTRTPRYETRPLRSLPLHPDAGTVRLRHSIKRAPPSMRKAQLPGSGRVVTLPLIIWRDPDESGSAKVSFEPLAIRTMPPSAGKLPSNRRLSWVAPKPESPPKPIPVTNGTLLSSTGVLDCSDYWHFNAEIKSRQLGGHSRRIENDRFHVSSANSSLESRSDLASRCCQTSKSRQHQYVGGIELSEQVRTSSAVLKRGVHARELLRTALPNRH